MCRFLERIQAASEDQQHDSLRIQSQCETIRTLAERLEAGPVDGYEEIRQGFGGAIQRSVRETLRGCCSGCRES